MNFPSQMKKALFHIHNSKNLADFLFQTSARFLYDTNTSLFDYAFSLDFFHFVLHSLSPQISNKLSKFLDPIFQTFHPLILKIIR